MFLHLLSRDRRVYVDQVTPPVEVRMSVEVGAAYPLHAVASSKAFLAYLPEDHRRRFLAGRLESMTDATIVDVGVLELDLEATRARGYAVSVGERVAGAGSIAAPLWCCSEHSVVPVHAGRRNRHASATLVHDPGSSASSWAAPGHRGTSCLHRCDHLASPWPSALPQRRLGGVLRGPTSGLRYPLTL